MHKQVHKLWTITITIIITVHIHVKAYSRQILTGKRANLTLLNNNFYFFLGCASTVVQAKFINQSLVCREQLSNVLQLFVLIAGCEKTCQFAALLKLKDTQYLPLGKF